MAPLPPRSPLDHHSIQVLRSLHQEDPKIQKIFSGLQKYLNDVVSSDLDLGGTGRMEEITIESLVSKSKSEDIIHLFRAIASLGKSAEEDLKEIERCRSSRDANTPFEEEIYGFTGVHLKPQQETQDSQSQQVRYDLDNVFYFKKDPLPQDESLQKFELLLRQCQDLLKQFNPDSVDMSKFNHLLELEDELMVNLRRHRTLVAAGLDLSEEGDDVRHNIDLHRLFKGTYDILGYTKDVDQTELKSKLLTCGWIWENGPPASVLASAQLEGMALRVYGLEQNDLGAAKMFVTLDGDRQPLETDQKEIPLKPSAKSIGGILLQASKVSLKNLKGDRKRGQQPKLYRIACNFSADVHSSSLQFECTSVPFTIRTGSPQLWQYTAHIIWFIWTQRDMREPEIKCPFELDMTSVLALVQAKVSGAGLSLRHMPSRGTGLASPRRRLTDGERHGWEAAIYDRCGTTGQGGKISRDIFTKPPKQANASSDFCFWTLVCAAVNTGLRLKKYNLDRYFYIGLHNTMCSSLRTVRDGELIFRSSLNRVQCSSGQEPLANVVFEVCSQGRMHPMVITVERLEQWSLREVINTISVNQLGNKIIRWILPGKELIWDICEGDEPKAAGRKKGLEYTNLKQTELPPETVLSLAKEMQSMSVDSKHGDRGQQATSSLRLQTVKRAKTGKVMAAPVATITSGTGHKDDSIVPSSSTEASPSSHPPLSPQVSLSSQNYPSPQSSPECQVPQTNAGTCMSISGSVQRVPESAIKNGSSGCDQPYPSFPPQSEEDRVYHDVDKMRIMPDEVMEFIEENLLSEGLNPEFDLNGDVALNESTI